MSRGGRGGFRGGRGGTAGGGPGARKVMGGLEVTWEVDPDLKVEWSPSELFPAVEPNYAEPPTRRERAQVAKYRSLRDRIHEGPLYTVLGDGVRVTKPGASRSVIYDAFEGMPTYSQRYRRVKRKIPRLDTRPYVKEFFPMELWSTLDPQHASADGAVAKKKRLRIAQTNRLSRLEEFDDDEAGRRAQQEGDEIEDDEDDPEDVPEEEQDDDFAEATDDDEPDDYNAEAYFDNGEEDFDDGGGDGDFDDAF